MEAKVGSYGSFLDKGLDIEISVKYSNDSINKEGMVSILTTSLERTKNDVYNYIVRNDNEMIKCRLKTIKSIKCLFTNPVYFKEIPNEYDGGWVSPWFLVTTTKGVIKIGWRKRVINIDWSESDVTANAEHLFPEETVTKFDRTIHAWGYDKAKEYIERILS